MKKFFEEFKEFASSFLSDVVNFIFMAFVLFCLLKAINSKRMIASTLTAVSRFRGLPHISILVFLCAPVNPETMVTDLLKMIDLFLPYGLGSPSGDIQSNHMVLSC